MSASAIADGIITNLSAASVFGTGRVSKTSYQILESSACQAAMVHWTRLRSTPSAFGNPRDRERTWNFNIECFLRDTGDPIQLKTRIWSLTDTVIASLESDDTLQGTCDSLSEIAGTHDPKSGLDVGGARWLTMDFNVEVTEL
ncbi:MAG: hypothetical protein WC742_15365 [Gallionellaceae bacterium]|jgi:hypothetical protein